MTNERSILIQTTEGVDESGVEWRSDGLKGLNVEYQALALNIRKPEGTGGSPVTGEKREWAQGQTVINEA